MRVPARDDVCFAHAPPQQWRHYGRDERVPAMLTPAARQAARRYLAEVYREVRAEHRLYEERDRGNPADPTTGFDLLGRLNSLLLESRWDEVLRKYNLAPAG